MRFFCVIIILFFLSGCENLSSFLKDKKNQKLALKLQKEEIEKLLQEADSSYQIKKYNEALLLYKKVLVLEPENQISVLRIQEINNWVPLINKRENILKQKYDVSVKQKDDELKQKEKEQKLLQEKIQEKEKEQKLLLIKMSSLKALASAVDALSVHNFEMARTHTKKAMMGYPESLEIQNFWNKINDLEDDFLAIEKMKKEEQKQKKKFKKTQKIKKQIENEIESFKDPFQKEAEIFQVDMDERIKRKAKSELNEIVDKEFAFKGILDQNKKMKSVELDFLREQSLIVFNKAIKDYEKDEQEGLLSNFDEKELKIYRSGVAESYYWIGVFYRTKSMLSNAITSFNKIKESFSETKFYHPALYQLGDTYQESGDLDLAYQTFEILIDTPLSNIDKKVFDSYEEWNDKDLKFNYEALKKNSFMKIAEIRLIKKEFDFALEIFENLAVDYKNDEVFYDEVILKKANVLLEKGDFEEAYKIYESLISKGRKCGQYDKSVFFRAKTLLAMSKFDEARQKLEEIFLYDPLNTFRDDATYLFGETYFIQEDYSKSIVHIRKALEEFPNFENRGYYSSILGKSYFFLGLNESAIEVFENLINEYSDLFFIPEVYYYLAKAYYDISRYDEAKKMLFELGENYPYNEFSKKGKYLLAEIYYNEKKYARAEKQFRIASLSQPESIIAFKSIYYRQKCLREMKSFDLLNKYLKDIVIRNDLFRSKWDNALNKDKAEYEKYYYKILFEYGDFLMFKEDYDNAILMFERVVKEYPSGEDKGWALYLIGKSYELKKDNKNAVLSYKNALTFNVDSFWGQQAQHNMNKILWDEKNYKNALAISGVPSEQRTD